MTYQLSIINYQLPLITYYLLLITYINGRNWTRTNDPYDVNVVL